MLLWSIIKVWKHITRSQQCSLYGSSFVQIMKKCLKILNHTNVIFFVVVCLRVKSWKVSRIIWKKHIPTMGWGDCGVCHQADEVGAWWKLPVELPLTATSGTWEHELPAPASPSCSYSNRVPLLTTSLFLSFFSPSHISLLSVYLFLILFLSSYIPFWRSIYLLKCWLNRIILLLKSFPCLMLQYTVQIHQSGAVNPFHPNLFF